MTDQKSLQGRRPAFRGRITASVLRALVIAVLVAAGMAAFNSTQVHQAVTYHTNAPDSGRSGAMMVYEAVW